MNAATLEFIRTHANDDVRKLALGRVPNEVNLREALTQIEGRQLAARKLPLLAATDGILFPPRLSLEQCSSETTAAYKRDLIARLAKSLPRGGSEGNRGLTKCQSALSGRSLTPKRRADSGEGSPSTFTDLTGGFGIDFMAIAPLFSRAVYVERNPDLCELARHNLPLMGLPHAEVRCEEVTANSSLFTHHSSFVIRHSSFILIDPARRDAAGRKVALIEDCTPDVCGLQEQLRASARYTLIKLSPMLDLTAALRALDGIVEAHVVSVAGECKELLLVMEGGNGLSEQSEHSYLNIPIYCVDLKDEPTTFRFTLAEEKTTSQDTLLPSSNLSSPFGEGSGVRLGAGLRLFLYEPNPSILKAGAFKSICRQYPVQKVAKDSHLYVSDQLLPEFPGRKWQAVDIATFNKKDLKRLLADIDAADLTVRGFPLSVASLRKQLHLREGGSHHLIATTLADGTKILLKVLPTSH
ncbi:MAG: hypothetical protein IJQ59_01495 [Bacteroidaceae bacterium]|nr:hypothetical protein [Bacteroidaceae bacterium]